MRALRTGAARPALPGREWAAVSCYADPVDALTFAAWVMDTSIWQWAPVPANLARAVLDSGALRHIRRVVELGAAHAGRCAAATALGLELSTQCRARRAAARACGPRPLTRRCRRRVPAAELNEDLIGAGACPRAVVSLQSKRLAWQLSS